jgi:hypothetical protein
VTLRAKFVSLRAVLVAATGVIVLVTAVCTHHQDASIGSLDKTPAIEAAVTVFSAQLSQSANECCWLSTSTSIRANTCIVSF